MFAMQTSCFIGTEVVRTPYTLHAKAFPGRQTLICCSAEVTSGGRIEGNYQTPVIPGKDSTTRADHASQPSEEHPEPAASSTTSAGRIEANYQTSLIPGKDNTTAADHGNDSQNGNGADAVAVSFACKSRLFNLHSR